MKKRAAVATLLHMFIFNLICSVVHCLCRSVGKRHCSLPVTGFPCLHRHKFGVRELSSLLPEMQRQVGAGAIGVVDDHCAFLALRVQPQWTEHCGAVPSMQGNYGKAVFSVADDRRGGAVGKVACLALESLAEVGQRVAAEAKGVPSGRVARSTRSTPSGSVMSARL